MSTYRLGVVIWPRWTIFCGMPLRISVTLSIQTIEASKYEIFSFFFFLFVGNMESKLPFMGLKPKQSKMYWKIGLIEWSTVRSAVAVIWMMLCFILKWKGSIFLMKAYFWKNIHKVFFIADSNSKSWMARPVLLSRVRPN